MIILLRSDSRRRFRYPLPIALNLPAKLSLLIVFTILYL